MALDLTGVTNENEFYTHHYFGRIVERARAFAKSRSLPVVVVVEAAEPAIVIDRDVEVNFVARRAELGRLLPHERLR